MKTRLRPRHRRALLAVLPDLASELSDGRLVALAAEVLADRTRDERPPESAPTHAYNVGPMVMVGGHPLDARGAALLGLRPDPPPITLQGGPLDIIFDENA